MNSSLTMHPIELVSREELEAREEQWLAGYAMKSSQSRGRQHPEPEDSYRTAFRRDRDRVIHTTAFRRLEYKTQVFVNHEGDHYRTRLTHTLEVAQIAVSIARVLRLNEDLVEAVALAHDIGHPPFGHAGEDALRELMAEHGGFDHNIQGLRLVDLLEARYPDFPGLNLTWEARESINKHRTPYDQPGMQVALDPNLAPLLESQIADVADEIAYDNHDLDDGLASGILKEADLKKIDLWREASESADKTVLSPTGQACGTCDDASSGATSRPPVGVSTTMPPTAEGRGAMAGLSSHEPETHRYQIIRTLINRQITDLLTATIARLKEKKIRSIEEVRHCQQRLVFFSSEMEAMRRPLKQLLWNQFYHHYRVMRMADKAKRFIGELFHLYVQKPEQLPRTTHQRIIRGEDPYRVVCDYIAGMTDRYCLEEYKKLFDPFERV
ncbi:MAG: dNTP triphosphohydrolase [Candidatus Omnitrophica bacterium]|nr:dNTP triphosphohydrolase [Candidatus Omnitrophota bacterium]